MKVDINFRDSSMASRNAEFELKFWELKADCPDHLPDKLFVEFGDDPDREFAFFETVVERASRRGYTTHAVIFTRLESRGAEAPRVGYLLPSYSETPRPAPKHVDSMIESEAKVYEAASDPDGADLESATEDKVTEAEASRLESDRADADSKSADQIESSVTKVSLFSAAALDQLIEKEKTKAKDDQKRLVDYETMKRMGAERHLKRAPALNALASLGRRFPNFGRAMESVLGAAALSHLAGGPFSFPPMLLVGPPGVGKTYFASELALLVGVDHQFISMETMQASWVLTGTHNGWSTAEIGRVGECLIRAEMANPLFLIDEVDKALTGSYNPLAPLYALLEPRTAAIFRDEFLSIELNASHANWIMTANETKSIPAPLLSRMNVVEVPAPTRDEALQIARQIYCDLLKSATWGKKFEDTPSDALTEGLLTHPPRAMRAVLLEGFGRAAIAGRNRVEPKDLRMPAAAKAAIGFASALL